MEPQEVIQLLLEMIRNQNETIKSLNQALVSQRVMIPNFLPSEPTSPSNEELEELIDEADTYGEIQFFNDLFTEQQENAGVEND